MRPASGILLVDKPGGITSHDVVARTRRAFGTRKIGHAGTLDPMATGLLVLGVEDATRLLTYIVGLDKTYETTIRLGQATTTDDAEGDVVSTASEEALAAASDERIADGVAALTGRISQVPSTFSAIKVDGKRAYDLARSGQEVALKAREVTISRFAVHGVRRGDGWVDVDATVDCSSGTYIRALARDLGDALGTGGHLTMLRRTRIGPFPLGNAAELEDGRQPALLDPAEVAARVLGRLDVTADEARDLRHGKRLAAAASRLSGENAAAIDPDGRLIGIVERRGDALKSAMNMPEEPA
ncbi:tRNA pseudouridine(55) synthase TruB [Microbacterium marinilacus]|uniref:tRNA pseudouridine synthase B n=1 Tax=Microbacterium marinilacus TaxID=415209 RepID=A0ABP7BPB6_9MICO|nr:tRNA pseudouridine(55) synthase TruB [Microbacterium marinilacus]MBY0689917.1 tRNA pseudouridine(55) synthase TruB [Microbacterium marinilacus]